ERWTELVQAMARDMNLSFEEAASIPVGQIADSDEVANPVTFLASDLAFFVNGTMIEIDGAADGSAARPLSASPQDGRTGRSRSRAMPSDDRSSSERTHFPRPRGSA